ncbi:MAG: hypothetical protein AAGH53_08480 [Pseudomonadota bacterium]
MDEDIAKKRFAIISMVRLGSAALVLIGLLRINKVIDWIPEMLGFLSLAFGLAVFFFIPVVLVRRWRTPPEDVSKQ